MCPILRLILAGFWLLTLLPASAAEAQGTILTPGPIVVSYGNTAVVSVVNIGSVPLVNVIVAAVGARDAVEFQQTFAIPPGQSVDVVLPPAVNPADWQPLVFVPAGQPDDSVYCNLFIQQGVYTQTTFADPPAYQYPNKLWQRIPKSSFAPPEPPTYGELPAASRRTLGPLRIGRIQRGDAVLVKNVGAAPMRAFVFCLDRKGQRVRGCGGSGIVRPRDDTAVYTVQDSKAVFFVLCADNVSALWADLVLGSTNHPNAEWDVYLGPEFCGGELRW